MAASMLQSQDLSYPLCVAILVDANRINRHWFHLAAYFSLWGHLLHTDGSALSRYRITSRL